MHPEDSDVGLSMKFHFHALYSIGLVLATQFLMLLLMHFHIIYFM